MSQKPVDIFFFILTAMFDLFFCGRRDWFMGKLKLHVLRRSCVGKLFLIISFINQTSYFYQLNSKLNWLNIINAISSEYPPNNQMTSHHTCKTRGEFIIGTHLKFIIMWTIISKCKTIKHNFRLWKCLFLDIPKLIFEKIEA